MLDRLDEAKAVTAEVLPMQPNFRIQEELPTYKRKEAAERVRTAMLKAGLPD